MGGYVGMCACVLYVYMNVCTYKYMEPLYLMRPAGYSNRPIPLYNHTCKGIGLYRVRHTSQELTRDLSDKLVLTCSMSKHPLICPPLDWEPHYNNTYINKRGYMHVDMCV